MRVWEILLTGFAGGVTAAYFAPVLDFNTLLLVAALGALVGLVVSVVRDLM